MEEKSFPFPGSRLKNEKPTIDHSLADLASLCKSNFQLCNYQRRTSEQLLLSTHYKFKSHGMTVFSDINWLKSLLLLSLKSKNIHIGSDEGIKSFKMSSFTVRVGGACW